MTKHRELGRRIVGTMVTVAVTLSLGLAFAPSAQATRVLRGEMYRATNTSRLDRAQQRLRLDARMSSKARRHSVAMANAGRLFHTSNVNTYLKGHHWTRWGENVGMTTENISVLERAFMHSPEHRTNILNGTFKHVAVGAIHRGGKLWVTVFFYG
jgi:uncharacterized protein YkwD